jgi:hypothetical protein
MKDIHAAAPEEREKEIRRLLDWLREKADLKRQVLTKKARAVAEHYHMQATAEALAARQADKADGKRPREEDEKK